jgi:hypothetical protein
MADDLTPETGHETEQDPTLEHDDALGLEQEEQDEEMPEGAGDAALRALQAERNARKAARRELRETREKLTEAEAKLAELEGVAARAAELEARLSRHEAEALRATVAAEMGLPPKLAARLNGTTAEELRADAEELLPLLHRSEPPSFDGGPRGPAPSPKRNPAAEHGRLIAELAKDAT